MRFGPSSQPHEHELDEAYTHWQLSPPAPIDMLLIHRKIGGMYLLASRLNAKVNLQQLFEPYRLEH
ncbi:ubiquinone biosynthesis monooxygenase UbiB [Agarivorans albus MKT 106]|uniref:Ubiquinone biosynthesis monooxygenase UbiB n=1 Tax=Agarivorans albus MKT 106 TaxID=1331007 RepID=R9PRA5_AGAAL|nr:ubiquinone biosynthesis monooxygenase UbiB [Agarivorans albus MKT 106]